MAGWMWTLATILGPVLLIGVIGWAMLRNRGGTRREVDRAERGAVDLRHELDDEANSTDGRPRNDTL